MNVLVTGATGFLGRHVVAELLAGGHAVTAAARHAERARALSWFGRVRFVECDVHRDPGSLFVSTPPPDVLVHLAWPGLPNYKDLFHLDVNLPGDLRLLRRAVDAGVGRLVVAGTCLEYGLQSGPLAAATETRPVTPYGLAKDTLRRALEIMRRSIPFELQWVRLFYMHGEGQNPGSLLAQLDRAIDEGRGTFDMSRGDQLRDYLPVAEVARCFRKVVENAAIRGVVNCCSGRPISVAELVERRLAERGVKMRLNRGRYPVPDYEPHAFWGIPTLAPAATLEGFTGMADDPKDEGAIDRMRLSESLRALGRGSELAADQAFRLAELEGEVASCLAVTKGLDAELARVRQEMHERERLLETMRVEIGERERLLESMRQEKHERERLLESMGQEMQAREQAAAAAQLQLQQDLEARDAELARARTTLAEDGHRLVTAVGAMLARHPWLASLLRRPLRLVSRLLTRA